jgi:hypothetical protein
MFAGILRMGILRMLGKMHAGIRHAKNVRWLDIHERLKLHERLTKYVSLAVGRKISYDRFLYLLLG